MRRADPRPRGRRRPRREARRPRRGVRGRRVRRVRPARGDHPRQRRGHRVARRRPGRRVRCRPGRDRRAEGLVGRRGPRSRRRDGCPRSAGPHRSLGHGRDAARDAARRGDRRRVRAADRAGDGDERPRQGAVRRARAGPRPVADRALAGAAGRPRHRHGDRRRRLQRREGHRRLPGRVPPGPRDGLRRQDPHPPGPGRGCQRRVRPERAGRRGRARASCRPGRTARVQAWSPTRAGWSSPSTSTPPGGRWPSTRRSALSRG